MKRKTLLLLTIAILSISTAFSQGGTIPGSSLTWQLSGTAPNMTLTISGSGAMPDYGSGYDCEPTGTPWDTWRNIISAVIIGNGVTTIGDGAFVCFPNLISVTISNSVTKIGDPAEIVFQHSSSLNSINVDVNNPMYSSNNGILYSKLQDVLIYCPEGKIGVITIPSSVIKIGTYSTLYLTEYLNFSNCKALTSINVDVNNPAFSSNNGILYNKSQDILLCCPRGKTGAVVIPNGVITIGRGSFNYNSNLSSITIPNSVTRIGSSAFFFCSGLTSITIPESITNIENTAFSYSGLTSITSDAIFPPILGSNVFYNVPANIPVYVPCGSLSNYLQDNNWKKFTNIIGRESNTIIIETICYGKTYVFGGNSISEAGTYCDTLPSVNGCDSIVCLVLSFYQDMGGTTGSLTWSICDSTLTISGIGAMPDYTSPNFAPWYSHRAQICTLVIGDGVTKIGNYAFYYHTNLRGTLTIPNSVTYIGSSVFQSCSNLTGTLFIPNFVTSIGYNAFLNCSGLQTVTIGNSVTSIGNDAFYGCSGLTTLNFNAINCADFSSNYWLYNTPLLTTLNIGSNVKRIPAYAFYEKSSFSGSLTIPDSVTSIGSWAFSGCSGLTTLNFNATNCADFSEKHWLSNTPLLITLNIGNNVERIPSRAFYGKNNFSGSLTIPNSVTSIGNNAFFGCSGFTGSLTIPDSVTSIGNDAFSGCSGLTTLNFNAINCADFSYNLYNNPWLNNTPTLTTLNVGNNVERIPANAFYRKSSFTGPLTIPNSVTSIGENAFASCSGFTDSLTIGNSVTSIGNAAFAQSGFTGSLSIPNSVTSIGDGTFSGCSGFTGTLTIPNSVTSIGISAFNSCSGFTSSLTIPNQVTTIEGGVFHGCSGFTGSLSIGNSVTSIGAYAFSGCSGLTGTLIIPNSVTFIEDAAFRFCGGFTSITSHPITPPIIDGSYTFHGIPKNIPVSVQCLSLDGYQSAPIWNNFTNYQTIDPPPAQPDTIIGSTTVCAGGSSQIYSISAVSGATSYIWSLPNGWSGSSTTTSITATPGANAQSGNITVKAINECGSSSERILTVTVNTAPEQPGSISGPNSLCADGSVQIYNISAVSGATDYTWTLPSGWNGSSTTTTISAILETNAQSGNISVTANNSCGSSAESTFSVTVNIPPTAPNIISGKSIITLGDSTTLTVVGGSEGTGCTYQWGTEICGSNIISGQSGSSITVSPTANTTYWVRRVGNSPCNNIITDCATVSVSVIIPIDTIINVPTNAIINVPLTLTSTVLPENATNKIIEWSLVYAGTTNAQVISGVLYTSAVGTAVVRATITNGKGVGNPYTQDFNIAAGTVGIPEQIESKITLYPNPTTGQLTIESSKFKVQRVEIYDVYGRRIQSFSPSVLQSINLIDITVLHPGIYFVKISTEAGIVTKKVVKE